MKIYYEYFPKYELFIQKYIGEWSIEQYKLYIHETGKNDILLKCTKILTDFRELTQWNEIIKDLEMLSKMRKEVIINKYLNVMLVDKPIPTALVHSYQEIQTESIQYFYCSTVQQSIRFLGLETVIDESKIENMLKNLQNKF